MAEHGVVLDFNTREYEQIVLLGQAQVRNRAWSLNRKAFRLTVSIEEPAFFLPDAGTCKPVSLDMKEGMPLVAIERPGQMSLDDRKAVSDKEYPLYFDPRGIQDCPLPVPAQEHALQVAMRTAMKARWKETQYLDYEFKLLLRPERDRLDVRREGKTVSEDTKQGLIVEYKAGESTGEVCAYQLKNITRHRYSRPANGYLRVEATRADGSPLEGVVSLQGPDEHPTSKVLYSLAHAETLHIPVVVDFTQLVNPIDRDSYRVIVYGSSQNDREAGEKTLDEWQLAISRAADRTSVSMRVIDPEQRESPALNEDRRTLSEPFMIGDNEYYVPVRTGRGAAQGRTPLFDLRLANACRNGFGFARWSCNLNISGYRGLKGKPHIQLVDEQGRERVSGVLPDSPHESERVVVLTAELDHDERRLHILQRLMEVEMTLGVDWEVYEDGEHHREHVRRFHTEVDIRCALKHEPPNHALAVDFGTSALAIAHAVGSQFLQLLPLQARLEEIASADQRIYRKDNPSGQSPFLSSACNVNTDEAQLRTLRPADQDFLTLPLLEDTIRSVPDKVFLSLKALLSAGFKTLPLRVQDHPYLGEDDKTLETAKEPPLDEVLEGAYRGLMQRYIKPILNDQGTHGFSHVLVAHPNSYTPNHVQQLRKVVEKIFVHAPDILSPHVIYLDNIHFCSESDAVAFYYLVHTHEWHEGDWSKVPNRERILVYDIGAGTLDLTHLEVEWEDNPYGKTPKTIHIKHRAGTNRAGNLLDECIARDLHEHLTQVLDADRYVNPIVVPSRQKMDPETVRTMDQLRQEIQQLKVQLAEGGDEGYRLLLTPRDIAKPIVRSMGGETASLYANCPGITVISNQVYWTPSRTQLMHGRYVQAFFEQVTQQEVHDFFNDRVPPLDTVIISGRTSLWPGFENRLRESLGAVPTWVSFHRDATALKQAVVLGVMERHFRWPDLVVEDPGIVGEFVVRYEHSRPYDWRYHRFERSEDSHEFYLGNAVQVQIGVRTSNGFRQCFAFSPGEYYSSDKMLAIKLLFDRQGILRAEVTNSHGHVRRFQEVTEVATLPYTDRPWPLGASKLVELEPEEAVTADTLAEPLRRPV